jgi:hypothetical protein
MFIAICKVRKPANVLPDGLSVQIVETTYFDQHLIHFPLKSVITQCWFNLNLTLVVPFDGGGLL